MGRVKTSRKPKKKALAEPMSGERLGFEKTKKTIKTNCGVYV